MVDALVVMCSIIIIICTFMVVQDCASFRTRICHLILDWIQQQKQDQITILFIKTNLSIGAVIFGDVVIVVIIISSRGITERNALKMISLQKVKWEMCTEWNGLLRL